jgi:hypothetical protein
MATDWPLSMYRYIPEWSLEKEINLVNSGGDPI